MVSEKTTDLAAENAARLIVEDLKGALNYVALCAGKRTARIADIIDIENAKVYGKLLGASRRLVQEAETLIVAIRALRTMPDSCPDIYEAESAIGEALEALAPFKEKKVDGQAIKTN